jgi:hypothetical protein
MVRCSWRSGYLHALLTYHAIQGKDAKQDVTPPTQPSLPAWLRDLLCTVKDKPPDLTTLMEVLATGCPNLETASSLNQCDSELLLEWIQTVSASLLFRTLFYI